MDEGIKEPVSQSGEDILLVRAFRGGDKEAFDKLVVKHKDRLFNLCYGYLGDYEEANDSAQETFLKAYSGLKGFRFESAFSTWLYRIAVNTCKNKLKSSDYRHRKKMISLEREGNHNQEGSAVAIQDGSPSPAVQLEERQKEMLIKAAVKGLPEEHREMITLRDLESLSYEEIAGVTGLTMGTVKSRIARARLDLGKRLEGIV